MRGRSTSGEDVPCLSGWTWVLMIGRKAEILGLTPPKINIEPENDGLEDDLPFPGVYSQVPC